MDHSSTPQGSNLTTSSVILNASTDSGAILDTMAENKRHSSSGLEPNSGQFNFSPEVISRSSTAKEQQTFSTNSINLSRKLLGKKKYITDYGVLSMYNSNKCTETHGVLLLFHEGETDKIVFSYHEGATGNVYARSFSDEELEVEKKAAGIDFSWAPFFKSIATAFIKSTASVAQSTETQRNVSFTIFNSKEDSRSYLFKIFMDIISNSKFPSMQRVFHYVLKPLSQSLQRYHCLGSKRVAQTQRIECETATTKASLCRLKNESDRLALLIYSLCEGLSSSIFESMKLSNELRHCEAQIRELKGEGGAKKHPLDTLYDDGGPQQFNHTPWSLQHYPYESPGSEILFDCICAAFPLRPGSTLDNISKVLELPDIKKRLRTCEDSQNIVEAFGIFKSIDQWNCDTIGLDILTDGNSLLYMTYLLMYKLDLVSYFNIDDQVLRNFLVGLQGGYHANPYHNAMHAADVTHIIYYILIVAGLCDKCCLTQIEIFAALIAGAAHDFDHPGLNNNFHTRTNAHLAIRYNDRSILENHHAACVFELLRNPRYNILATLNEQQKSDFRAIMLDMILATDMGNHAKIFKSFQVRVSEPEDWHSKKEDVMLALRMSIKMADVSNCVRPNHIYMIWARNVANEFLLQGDAERSLHLSISPFMDRTKDKGDFVKGQIAFMMFIVGPLMEAISELLPSLSFMNGFYNENLLYWKIRSEKTTT